jgi:hypothetical protein
MLLQNNDSGKIGQEMMSESLIKSSIWLFPKNYQP